MDYNKHIVNNMSNRLKSIYEDCDILLKPLNKFKDIKQWVQYLHKDKVLIFPPMFDILEKYIYSKELHAFKISYIRNYNLKNNCKIDESSTSNLYKL